MTRWFKWYIRIVNRLGFRKEPEVFYLFTTDLSIKEIIMRLEKAGYFYNDLSTTYKGQCYTMRRTIGVDYQIHLRIYKDRLTGHYETSSIHPSEHLKGRELRKLHPIEIEEIRKAVDGQT